MTDGLIFLGAILVGLIFGFMIVGPCVWSIIEAGEK